MAERDSQSIVLSRQSILLVTAVGVGLLTLCYVLGVQIGKQSAALRPSLAKGSGEELESLPSSLDEQMKNLEGLEQEKQKPVSTPTPKPTPIESPKPEAKPETKPSKSEEPAPKAKAEEPKKDAAPAGDHWTAQLVSTTDPAEANRVAAKAKAAGFAATTVREKGSIKVRLSHGGKKADVDATVSKLKAKGLNAFAVKAE
jgi:cell division protein FtsN